MSNDADENSNKNDSLLITVEQQLQQLVLELKSNELILKTTQENLNDSIKHNILLEQELESEQHDKSMIKMELDTLTAMMSNKKNNSELNVNILKKERKYLEMKLFKLQAENMELKRVLTKKSRQVSLLLESQYKYPEKINLNTLMLNSLQEKMKKLENESHTLVKFLCAGNILAKTVLNALQYTKKLNKTKFDYIQYLIKALATIKTEVHILIHRNEKPPMLQDDQTNRILSNQADLDVYKKLVETLEIENITLYKNLQVLKKSTVENDIEMTDIAME